jgi:subtilisin-like proprotein convertase family protein
MQYLTIFKSTIRFSQLGLIVFFSLSFSVQNIISQTFTASGLPVSIPDGSAATCYQSPGTTLNSTVTVSGLPGVVTALNQVTINMRLSHSWAGDLTVSITPPGGSPIVLISRTGSGLCGNSGDFLSGNLLSFNGNNVSTLPNSGNIPAGNYLPTAGTQGGTPGNLNSLIGVPYNGDWVLSVFDGTLADLGQLHFFSIDIIPCYPNYTFLGGGTNPTDPNDPTNWESQCLPILNDPNIVITVAGNAVFNASSTINGTVINNGTIVGNLSLIGNLINNGSLSPGN